jgi:hypothetical protein
VAALVVGGITVPVAVGGEQIRTPVEVGDRAQAFDGSALTTVRAYKRSFSFITSLMPLASADALDTALRTIPVSCSGDLIGTTGNFHGRVTGWRFQGVGVGARAAVSFELREA